VRLCVLASIDRQAGRLVDIRLSSCPSFFFLDDRHAISVSIQSPPPPILHPRRLQMPLPRIEEAQLGGAGSSQNLSEPLSFSPRQSFRGTALPASHRASLSLSCFPRNIHTWLFTTPLSRSETSSRTHNTTVVTQVLQYPSWSACLESKWRKVLMTPFPRRFFTSSFRLSSDIQELC
jgi:hypothetical protein